MPVSPRPVLLLAPLLLAVLAGCTDPAPTTRQDQLFINVTAQGPWTARFPLPDDALLRDALQEDLRISLAAGNTTFRFVDGDLPIEVSGNGTVRLEALPRWRDLADLLAFNDAQWTTGDMDDGTTRMEVLEGTLDVVRMEHTALACRGGGCIENGASSRTCFTEVKFFATDVGVGSHLIDVQGVGRTCQE